MSTGIESTQPVQTPTPAHVNRRASRRQRGRNNVKVECRKGTLGLGLNLAVSLLDLSECGACLVLKSALPMGQEVEVVFLGGYGMQPIKRVGMIRWIAPTDNNCHLIGVHFDRNIKFADLQRFTIAGQPLR